MSLFILFYCRNLHSKSGQSAVDTWYDNPVPTYPPNNRVMNKERRKSFQTGECCDEYQETNLDQTGGCLSVHGDQWKVDQWVLVTRDILLRAGNLSQTFGLYCPSDCGKVMLSQ